MAESSCPFCAIARGDSSVEVVCEGSDWLAFFPLEPATPGHTLIIPREHVADLWAASAPLAGTLVEATLRVGNAIRTALEPEGMNLITSAGRAAEQTIFHLHLHLVPRWRADGFGHIWPIEGKSYSDSRLEDAARLIRAKCQHAGSAQ